MGGIKIVLVCRVECAFSTLVGYCFAIVIRAETTGLILLSLDS